jgi:type I restriction enzyme S subunit
MEVTDVQYKESEIGVIPVDWEVKTLSTIGKFTKGQGIRKEEATNGEIPCIRYGELYTRHNDYIKEYFSFISKETAKTARRLKSGDILFAGSGETKEEIGKCAAFIDNIEAYAGGDIVILSPVDVSPLFLGYLLNAQNIQKQKASKGQGDAIVHISANQLGSIQIPIPPTKSEQTAIANALSDTDSLIENLEKLIAKKRNIKQGVMQELLAGSIRLDGFEKKWLNVSLGEISEITMGQSPQSKYYNTKGLGLPLVQGNADIEDRKTIIRIHTTEITKIGEPGTTIMSVRAPVGEIAKTNFRCCLGRGVCAIKYKNDFLYHLLIYLEDSWGKYSTGSTFDSINSSQVMNLEIYIPSDFSEQVAIASIFNDIDEEIETLEEKLFKYKMIKQGMMQSLLTGKIRLV